MKQEKSKQSSVVSGVDLTAAQNFMDNINIKSQD